MCVTACSISPTYALWDSTMVTDLVVNCDDGHGPHTYIGPILVNHQDWTNVCVVVQNSANGCGCPDCAVQHGCSLNWGDQFFFLDCSRIATFGKAHGCTAKNEKAE
jgi:hypothetical protein